MDTEPRGNTPGTTRDGSTVPAQVADLGEYFVLPPAEGPDWRALSELFTAQTMVDLVAATRGAIASGSRSDISDIPVRVAASSLQLGIAARLLSPLVGSVTTVAAIPLLTADSLRWKAVRHAVHFGVTRLEWLDTATPAAAADAISATVLKTVFTPLNDALQGLVSLSPKVLWGNVTSAANGAVTVLGMTAPHLAPAGRELIAALASAGPLRGTADLAGGTFVRRNCCLFYLAPQSGLCGDCVLSAPDASH